MPFATRQVAVTARPQSPLARAALELVAVPQGTPAPQGEPGGPEGALVAFPAGDRMGLAVAVTAQDGRTLRYLIEVRRQPPERNADLSSLVPSAGALVPAFNARIVSYTLRLPAAVETAVFNLATAGKAATVRVEAPAVLSGTTLSVPVAPGQTLELNILVVAEDGTQRLYRVGITRESPDRRPTRGAARQHPAGPAAAGGRPARGSRRAADPRLQSGGERLRGEDPGRQPPRCCSRPGRKAPPPSSPWTGSLCPRPAARSPSAPGRASTWPWR